MNVTILVAVFGWGEFIDEVVRELDMLKYKTLQHHPLQVQMKIKLTAWYNQEGFFYNVIFKMTLDLKFVRSGVLAKLDATYEFDKKTNQASELKISFNLINWKAVLLLAFVWTGFYWMVPDYWSQCDIWVEIRKRSCWCISPQCCMTPIWTLTSFIPPFLFLSLLYSPSCILVCSPPASKVSYGTKS